MVRKGDGIGRGFRNGVESASVITIAAPLLISWQIRRGQRSFEVDERANRITKAVNLSTGSACDFLIRFHDRANDRPTSYLRFRILSLPLLFLFIFFSLDARHGAFVLERTMVHRDFRDSRQLYGHLRSATKCMVIRERLFDFFFFFFFFFFFLCFG